MNAVVLWNADKLLTRLMLGEDSRARFMEVDLVDDGVRESRRQRIADELAASGNTLGGALIFSVSDAGEVRPMTREMTDALEAYVSEICADSIHPPLTFTTQRLALPDGSSALVVDVERSPLVHNRMYLYATNVAVDEGGQQPVHFKLSEALRLTDVHGAEWLVRFAEMIGNSSVLEYEPPPRVR